MFKGIFSRRMPVRPLPQYALVFLPTNTELFTGDVMACWRKMEEHAPDCSVSEMVSRGYHIRRAKPDDSRTHAAFYSSIIR